MEKRGISHIEIVVSFVLFIGFLIFGLYFFNPLSNERVLGSSLFYTIDAISDNASATLVVYAIVIDAGIENEVAIPLAKGPAGGDGVRVETTTGEKLDSNYDEERVAFNRKLNEFVFVKFGAFPYQGKIVNPVILDENNFSISSSDIKDVLSEQLLLSLRDAYVNNYEQVREDFNLPRRIDFSFSVVFSTEDKIDALKTIPQGIEVFSETKRVEVTRLDGSTAFADLIVKIW